MTRLPIESAKFAGVDPDTGRKRYLFETVRSPNNRAGAKAADAHLAQLIAAVEERTRARASSAVETGRAAAGRTPR